MEQKEKKIGEVKIADDVTVFDDVNDVIVSISGVKEDTADEEETAGADEPEVVEKGKKEEEA